MEEKNAAKPRNEAIADVLMLIQGATLMRIVVGVVALLICAASAAGELRATAGGKWIKAEKTAKAIAGQTTYRIYGLTRLLGEAKGSNPKAIENDVCTDTLSVSLSPEPEKGVIALAVPWNALPNGMRVACHQSSWFSHDSKGRRI